MQQAHTTDPRNSEFTANALKVLERRYFLRDEQGHICENPEQLFLRVAKAVAGVESQFGASESEIASLVEAYKDLMLDREFLPNSPTLFNAGKPKGQLSACFVLPVPDDLAGIFETCKHAALIHKTGGGTGFSFSRLRPQNDPVASSIGVASGPVSFMTVFDAATEAIRQGGTRRGANMGMLRVDHPDIEQFIHCKRDTSKLNNFNISVAVTDAFMQAVLSDSDYDLINPRTGEPTGQRLSAPGVFEMMVANAHATGEPGMVFIDRINAADPIRETLSADGKTLIAGTEDIEATNPCGEQPLGPGDACNLGSINVARFVKADGSGFDLDRLGPVVDLAVRFLDDVIEANHYPFDFVREATHNNRRIGLGIMGFADALIMQGIAYDSERGTASGAELMHYIQERAHRQSRLLAKQRGVFPNWPYSSWHDQGIEMRNATVTTIAPTGTISIIAGTSSGIEPLFAVSYVRRVMGGTELIEVNPLFEQAARSGGFYSPDLMARIAHQGTVAHDQDVPQEMRDIFVCAHDIDYKSHVEMQAVFQRYTDNAVSKTINFPSSATVAQIEQAYLSAWHLGLKGITVYRDASRHTQVLNIRKTDPKSTSIQATEPVEDLPKKPFNAGPEESATDSPAPAMLLDQIASIAMLYDSRDISLDERCPGCDTPSDLHVKYESCYLCPSCGYTKC